jgi:Raf kinase inhibitor-like YbhB/YbcL family protein
MKRNMKKIIYSILILISALVLLTYVSGCIGQQDKDNIEEVEAMQNISILADAFKYGEVIPSEYTCTGKDISPGLSWTGIPEGTKSVVLIMDDPDAPGGTFVHWVLFNIPAMTQKLPKAVKKDKVLEDFSRQGMTDFGYIGYGGPCPPPGKYHRYFFRIYALDKMLELLPGASRNQIDRAMKDHILANGELMGQR